MDNSQSIAGTITKLFFDTQFQTSLTRQAKIKFDSKELIWNLRRKSSIGSVLK